MSRRAEEVLALVAHAFPPALLPMGGEAALRAAAPALARASHLYFECRLAGSGAAVDLSEHFHAGSHDAQALAALAIRRTGEVEPEARAPWQSIAALARRWGSDPALAEITDVGLEHDVSPDGRLNPVPAIFAAFAGGVLAARGAAEAFAAALLPDALPALETLRATLEAAERHGMEGGRMVGLMFSRGTEMRTTVKALIPARLPGFLAEIGWPGPAETLARLIADPVFDDVPPYLILGFGPKLVREVGLEIIDPDTGSTNRSRLSDWLIARGAAEPGRVEAAEQWHGLLTPVDTGAAWPDRLIIDAIGAEPDAPLRAFSRGQNHVKLNLEGADIRTAKAYLTLSEATLGEARRHA